MTPIVTTMSNPNADWAEWAAPQGEVELDNGTRVTVRCGDLLLMGSTRDGVVFYAHKPVVIN